MTNDPELSEKISSEDDQGVDQPQPFSFVPARRSNIFKVAVSEPG